MLESIWFVLWGVLWAIYFVLDGFDLGMGTLMPVLAKSDYDRRMIYNAAGPFWDGNEVWLIAAGGVTFAAFPTAYAGMFSGLYTALMLLLFALILRGVAFEFRGKVDSPGWRKVWDTCLVVGSFLPALLLGVAFANIFRGLPLNEQFQNTGGLFDLLNPYGLAGGVLFVVMFCLHGSLWLAIRSSGDLQRRAGNMAVRLWPLQVLLIVVFLIWSAMATQLFTNYMLVPLLFLILALPVGGLIMQRTYMAAKRWWMAWFSSAVTIAGVALFGIIGLFPAIIPSSLNPAWSLTIWNSSSSTLTLSIMLGVAVVFVPIIILYQIWAYRHFSHPLTEEDMHY